MNYESGFILGSMCTKPDSVAVEAYNLFLETNLGDPGLFKGTGLIEKDVINILGKILHLDNACGHIVTGGTEANLMAICAAKYLFEKEHPGCVGEIILPRTAHFSFKKITAMLSLKPVYVPVTRNYKIDTEKIEDLITENTAAIVAIAGTTELGYVDDIKKISEIAHENNIYLHVDAAFGGFVIPFLDYPPDFDFSCRGVCSVTIDPHKMGLAPLQAGGIVFRKKEYLDLLSVSTPYLTHDHQTTIVGTRCGASAAAVWAVLKSKGHEGYKKIVKKAMDLTYYSYSMLGCIDRVYVREPELNLLSFEVEGYEPEYIRDLLQQRRWSISVSENPHALRIVFMPHVKKEHIDKFCDDLHDIIQDLIKKEDLMKNRED